MTRVLLVIIVALAVGVLAPTVHAGIFELKLTDGTTTFTIQDNSALDLDSGLGRIVWMGTVGVFDLNVTTGVSKPYYPSQPPQMDLNSINANSSSAGTLDIWLTDQDFSLPVDSDLVSTWGGTTSGTALLTQIFDPDNNLYGTGLSAITTPVSTVGPGGFNATMSVPVTADPSFSLTEHVTIIHSGAGTTSFDAISVVPVPAAVILGVLGIGVAGLKLRKHA